MLGRRSDGRLVRDVPAYRRLMPWLARGRNGSAVYFEQSVDLTLTDRFLERWNDDHRGTRARLLHVIMWAIVRTLRERPRLNRFVAGGRLWDRDGIWISFSAKKRLDDDAPIVVLKRRLDPAATFAALVAELEGDIDAGRSPAASRTDREVALLARLPPFGIGAAFGLARLLDRWGLLPEWFIRGDPMFASVFVANLGSLKMDAAYHHLYEYGSISIFCVIGRRRDEPVVVDGTVTTRRAVTLRYTYDERIEDGLYAQQALALLRKAIEDPEAHGIG